MPAGLTCDGVLAAMTLLGHIGLVAVHTVDVVLMGGETSSSQGLLAGVAHEALRVPGLVLVADPSGGDGLTGAEQHSHHDLRQSGLVTRADTKVIEYLYSSEMWFFVTETNCSLFSSAEKGTGSQQACKYSNHTVI